MNQPQLDALNFKVKSITTFLGYTPEDETIESKQAFVARHWAERVGVTDGLLQEAYEESRKED